eukprot:scaffold172448_cov43-Prasinocladus_malaysianus.AAC.2
MESLHVPVRTAGRSSVRRWAVNTCSARNNFVLLLARVRRASLQSLCATRAIQQFFSIVSYATLSLLASRSLPVIISDY